MISASKCRPLNSAGRLRLMQAEAYQGAECRCNTAIFAEPPVAAEPREATFHNPSQAGDLEGAPLPFHNHKLATILVQKLKGQLATLVSGIGHDDANARKHRPKATA
jgi:hypothetical protein